MEDASKTGAGGSEQVRALLEGLLAGDLGVDDVLQRLRLLQVAQVGECARLDVNRDLRKGVPEVVYAPRKSDPDLVAIVRRFLMERGVALVTRLEPERAEMLRRALEEEAGPKVDAGERPHAVTAAGRVAGSLAGLVFDYDPAARVLAAYTGSYMPPPARGCVGLLTAGTADIPVAEEAALVITHMGCRVIRGYDTGVAGLHRLFEPLSRMLEEGADVLVVVAGMEGALPSVVAGLVDLPVIGVPTSTGYGLGGDGTAALLSMLQTCSPGLVTVNIDNGVGAGAAAGLIARGRQR
jgi:NCAIR mutase (PurE)-related protein